MLKEYVEGVVEREERVEESHLHFLVAPSSVCPASLDGLIFQLHSRQSIMTFYLFSI
jgi:hypothetical protein